MFNNALLTELCSNPHHNKSYNYFFCSTWSWKLSLPLFKAQIFHIFPPPTRAPTFSQFCLFLNFFLSFYLSNTCSKFKITSNETKRNGTLCCCLAAHVTTKTQADKLKRTGKLIALEWTGYFIDMCTYLCSSNCSPWQFYALACTGGKHQGLTHMCILFI